MQVTTNQVDRHIQNELGLEDASLMLQLENDMANADQRYLELESRVCSFDDLDSLDMNIEKQMVLM